MIIAGVFFCSNCLRDRKKHKEKKEAEKKVIDRLEACSQYELNLIAMFVAQQSQTLLIDPIRNAEAVAVADQLVTKRLLVQTPGSMMVHSFTYAMPDFVWKHVKQNISHATQEALEEQRRRV